MSMKINNTFSSHTASTNASKKENKQCNKENTTAGVLSKKFDKLTISGEGTESYRKRISESGQSLTYNSVIQQKKILSGGINYSYNLSKEADKLYKTDEEALTDGNTLSWQTKLDNLGKAYINLRDEIVQGYENGTRQVNVIDESSETGYRTLTMEEELSALDAAYEKNVKSFEELSSQQENAKEIIDEWQEQVAGIKEGKISKQSVEEQEEQAEQEEANKDEEKSSGMVGINAGKLARMLAAAKTRSQVQAVMSKIQSDLSECEAGKNQGMDVDEESVKAAKQLLQEAKSRLGSAENREATPQEEMAAAIASLM